MFAIESEIAEGDRDQLQAKLLPTRRKPIEQPPTTDLAAFDLDSRRSQPPQGKFQRDERARPGRGYSASG